VLMMQQFACLVETNEQAAKCAVQFRTMHMDLCGWASKLCGITLLACLHSCDPREAIIHSSPSQILLDRSLQSHQASIAFIRRKHARVLISQQSIPGAAASM
jgi:hypothetical protein